MVGEELMQGIEEKKKEEQKKHTLFGKKQDVEAPQVDNFSAMSGELAVVGRRVRVLEERYANLRRKSQITEQNMLTTHKKSITDIKTLTAEVDEIKKNIDIMQTTIRQIIDELRKMAKKDEVKILEKYINLWEPIKFVTQDEVEKVVKEIIGGEEEKKKKGNIESFKYVVN